MQDVCGSAWVSPRSFEPKGLTVAYGRDLDCLTATTTAEALPVDVVRPEGLEGFLGALPAGQSAFVRASGFAGKAGQLCLLPAESGLAGAVFGLGEETGPHIFGALPGLLPAAALWRMGAGIDDPAAFVLGYCLGAYRFAACKSEAAKAQRALLVVSEAMRELAEVAKSLSAARAVWLVRDLINTPANYLGPADLAAEAYSILSRIGAHVNVITGESLSEMYPALHAVGRGSARAPAVVLATWHHGNVADGAPCISICGKGVCFDTGGYDLKQPAGMLRMKKDMGGAAIALGLATMIIEADLPCRLELRLGCVENMISGEAMRPLDVLNTRKGLRVEVGNTDAEGRLVLCDLLAEACEAEPDVLLDFATLTGAARVALGPDLPALFSNDDGMAAVFSDAGGRVHDPVWRLPLWNGYNFWLESDTGDLNNVTEKSFAGAIVAALFLHRFVSGTARWIHFDVYGWNDAARPGRPAGGEAHAMRAAFEGVTRIVKKWTRY
jgi:leucyl aminopeptidase